MALVVICGYCNDPAQLVTGREVYPHIRDLRDTPFYRCVPCKARVGCHPGTLTPLGRLANEELRKAKMAAHAAFDPIWKSKRMKRKQAYAWLADELGIANEDCHIGMFEIETCNRVVEICTQNTSAGRGDGGAG